MYVYHYDRANEQWNVFLKTNGREEYVCSFLELSEARAFCQSANQAVEVK